MTSKKTIVRHLLFAAVAAALGLYCTGCCTAAVLSGQFGSKTSRFDIPKYRMSPDRDAIIVWKALYLPPAVVLDTLLLPGYIAGSAYLYLLYLFVSPLRGIQ